MSETESKKGLDLTPNQIVGYRLTPELKNWTISLVKRRDNGVEYKQPMSYHKSIGSAVHWIYNHVSQLEGKNLQRSVEDMTGEVANQEILKQAFAKGLVAALDAVEALEKDLLDAGVPLKGLASNLSKILNTDEAALALIEKDDVTSED